MKRIKKIAIASVLVIIVSGLQAQVARNRGGILQDVGEEEYYYALIEATKQFVLENYQESFALYAECLKYKPESAAVNYQLSQIFIKAGDLNRALEFARKAFEIEKTNKWYLIQLITI